MENEGSSLRAGGTLPSEAIQCEGLPQRVFRYDSNCGQRLFQNVACLPWHRQKGRLLPSPLTAVVGRNA
ncbi:MAG: hypothetical protein LBT00_02060 [Spirochaetaceae bacterium]|nr:hypothetical protein [Spirochaetaceae bacterium]